MTEPNSNPIVLDGKSLAKEIEQTLAIRVFWVSGKDRRSSDGQQHESLPGTRYYSGSGNGTHSGRP